MPGISANAEPDSSVRPDRSDRPARPSRSGRSATRSRAEAADTPHCFRGRIGAEPGSGYYAAPHRYELYLSPSCPGCLRIAVTHGLLGLGDSVRLTTLPPAPAGEDPADPEGSGAPAEGGRAALRAAYEASCHGHRGPAAVPALTDRWTGRVVSNHAPDIVRDLALRFRGGGPELYPRAGEEEIGALTALLETGLTEAAQRAGRSGGDAGECAEALATLLGTLGSLEERLARGPYLLGEELTAADVHLWVALLELDTVHRWHLDAAAVHRIAEHERLWAYARRLLGHEAFRAPLDTGAIERGHHSRCRGREAAGAAVRIIDWDAGRPPVPGDSGRASRSCSARSAHSSMPERSTPATM